MSNTWCRIAACVFFCMASSAVAASAQETDFVLVALEQLRDRMERDDKGTLDEFVADVSVASELSAAASRDSLVSLLRDLKTHCKKLQLIVQDVLKDEAVLDQVLVITQDFMTDLSSDDESILDEFYQEAARTVAQEVSPLFE